MGVLSIGQLRHRVHLCSQKDAVVDGALELNREGVLSMWAMVQEKAASPFTTNGAANTDQEKRSHVIMTRYHPDFDISDLAWIYEERRKSAPRWFKILKVGHTETAGVQYFKFDVRLHERGEDVSKPKSSSDDFVVSLPDGVKL